MSDTTSRRRSNLGFSLSMCPLKSRLPTLSRLYFENPPNRSQSGPFVSPANDYSPERRQHLASWCPARSSCDRQPTQRLSKGTFEPTPAEFNIHMRHLTSSSQFQSVVDMRKCHAPWLARPLPTSLPHHAECGPGRTCCTCSRHVALSCVMAGLEGSSLLSRGHEGELHIRQFAWLICLEVSLLTPWVCLRNGTWTPPPPPSCKIE